MKLVTKNQIAKYCAIISMTGILVVNAKDTLPQDKLGYDKSKDLGVQAPEGADIPFDGTMKSIEDNWEMWPDKKMPISWSIVKSPTGDTKVLMTDGGKRWGTKDLVTKKKYKSFEGHVEFVLMGARGDGKPEGYANSGVYMQNRHELQIESPKSKKNIADPFNWKIGPHGIGAICMEHVPSQNAWRPNGQWHSFHFIYTAGKWEAEKPLEPARLTLWWNGIKVHDNVTVKVASGGVKNGPSDEGLKLQEHGQDVRYRNIWIKPLREGQGESSKQASTPWSKPKEKVVQNLASAKTDTSRVKGTARKWAHDLSDIKPDAKTLYGTLENGMRYVIHKNAIPPKRVSLRLHVDAGSLSEKESQRGVAHFLEHMVFNGTKTFPDATKLVPQMQRLGIAFGAHANAYTSFDETVYMLDLPDIKKSTIDLAFDVMGDFADGALLTDAEIDEERGVISSEKTSRDSINMRMMEKQFQHLMPNSLVPKRFPIGTDEVIANAPRSEFVDFYTRYYTPEKMTFIVVGDIDVAEMEQRIHNAFKGIKNPVEPGKPGSVGDVSGAKGFQTAVFSDKELSSTDVSLIQVRKKEKVIDSKENRAARLPLNIAHAVINRRFSRLAKKENATITSGSISSQVLFREAEIGSIDVTAKDGNWQAVVPVLEQELRRSVEHGFTQLELDEIIAGMMNGYEQNVVRAATKKTNAIASSFAKHVHGDYVYSTPADDLAIFQENLKTVTPESCHKALVDFWSTEDMTLVLSNPEKPENAEKALAALYQRSKLVKVEPVEEKKVAVFGYTNFGEPGAVVSESYIEDLDVYQIAFSNGVKVNYKQTDFDKNQVLITSNFGTGKLGMPQDKPGLDMLAGAVANGGGLGKHSADDLRTLLAGKNVGLGVGIGDESFTLGGATTPDDLELQLQLFCAYLTDSGFRPEAERQFKAQLPMLFSQLKHSAKGAQAKMSGWLRGGDGRFIIPTLEQAQALGTPDVINWMKPQMLESALEIGIVGDIDPKKLIPLLAKTIGALPSRKSAEEIADTLRTITVPKTPTTKKFGFESKVPTAIAIVAWKAEDNTKHDVKLARRAGILAEILSDRMRIKLREELGDAYSPGAASQLSSTFKNVGFVRAYSPVKPEDLDNVSKVILELGDKLAAEGTTEDELKRALTPRIGMLSKSLRQNSYWLGSVVAQSQTKPYMLEWARGREADYKAINLADINTLAKKYLSRDRSMSIKIAPDKQ